MRHRRRYNTQTIRRKNQTTTTRSVARENSGKTKKIFTYIAVLLIGAASIYAISEYLLPLLEQEPNRPVVELNTRPQQQNPSIPAKKEPAAQNQYYSPIKKKIQIEVLNGCGEQGIAKLLSDKLKAENYDIVNSGNYLEKGKLQWDVANTKIIDQIGDFEKAVELAELMGVNTSLVESVKNPSPIADITIVIGKDHRNLNIMKK
ncbi:MAG: LytR C-terminal domain-containing protein [Calditrichaceae bacterium]